MKAEQETGNPVSCLPVHMKAEKRCARTDTAFSRSIITLLVLARSLRFFTALDAGTLIMLSFANLGQNAGLGTAALKTLQRIVQGLALFHADFRH